MARNKKSVEENAPVETKQETKAPKLTLSNPSERTVQEDRKPDVRSFKQFTIITY